MEQHPVPQQISSYQFRLVGDMTLKQFFELAGGGLVGLLIYASAIPAFIKWPIIIACVLFGIALAFLPFEDRPLEIWVVSFIRSIYSPTLFRWQKTQTKEKYFQDETGEEIPLGVIAPKGQAELNKYLASTPALDSSSTKLEEGEDDYVAKIAELFGKQGISFETITTNAQGQSNPAPEPEVNQPMTQPAPAPAVEPAPQNPQPEVVFRVNTPPPAPIQTAVTEPTLSGTPMQGVAQAQFSVSASPPMPPTQPNTVSGQVMDVNGRIVEGAILEIKDAAGRPVRAVKTNKLGHFYIVTPLASGTYEIITEKDGYEFSPIRFAAGGTIIPSIAIRSGNALN